MNKTICLIVAITYLTGLCAAAQPVGTGTMASLWPEGKRIWPILDSSINVSKLSVLQRSQLIDKLLLVNQMYHIKLNKLDWDSKNSEVDRLVRLMTINDSVNQAILLKLLKIDGWPCDTDKDDKSLSYKAWIIVWHTNRENDVQQKFYPYLKTAIKNGCIHKNLSDQLVEKWRIYNH